MGTFPPPRKAILKNISRQWPFVARLDQDGHLCSEPDDCILTELTAKGSFVGIVAGVSVASGTLSAVGQKRTTNED